MSKLANSSLVVVGVGIKSISHVTIETKAYIEQSDKVLYLVNEPIMKDWIVRLNPKSESLDRFYKKDWPRLDCYDAISKYIFEHVKKNLHICVVMYGHPTVFAKPALDAVIQARSEGFDAKILPGISAEDCLFADLLINPGIAGCLSYEATDFLIRNRNIDTSCNLIIWQISTIGNLGFTKEEQIHDGVKLLMARLLTYYNPNHEVTLYEAAQYPHLKHKETRLLLSELTQAIISPLSTLYIPPLLQNKCDNSVLKKLGLSVNI